MIAALYVETGGCYFGLPDVDPWDEARDARAYAGPDPVVAHPPCQRWGRLWAGQPLHIKRTGERKVKGADGGCFAMALAAVRRWGGVLEHPWDSAAWPHFGLPIPPRSGGWISTGFMDGGWTCCVEQGRYGHYARKPTLLLTYGVDVPSLDWGKGRLRLDPVVIAQYEEPDAFTIVFALADRQVRFRVALPGVDTIAKADGRGRLLNADQRRTKLDQVHRQKARALLLVIKAKLESVESGVETFEQAFLPNVVLADGLTVYERIAEPIAEEYRLSAPQAMLLAGPGGSPL